MSQVVVKKKGIVIWNLLAFVVLSLSLVYVVEALSFNYSALRLERLRGWVHKNGVLIALSFINFIFLIRVKKIALPAMGGAIAFIIIKAILIISNGYSKGALLLLASYIPVAFIFYQLLKNEITEAYADPGYASKELFLPTLLKINVELSTEKGNTFSGWLSNWSSDSCFVYLGEHSLTPGEQINLTASLMNKSFQFKGVIVSYDKAMKGVGLRIKNDVRKKVNWSFFIMKLDNYGYHPKIIR